jgi:hypothetical protein
MLFFLPQMNLTYLLKALADWQTGVFALSTEGCNAVLVRYPLMIKQIFLNIN